MFIPEYQIFDKIDEFIENNLGAIRSEKLLIDLPAHDGTNPLAYQNVLLRIFRIPLIKLTSYFEKHPSFTDDEQDSQVGFGSDEVDQPRSKRHKEWFKQVFSIVCNIAL